MKQRGFTLIECILALLITSVVMLTIGWFLHSFEKVDHQSIDESAQWYLFLRELESTTHQFQLMGCGEHRIMLSSPVHVKYYNLDGNDDHIYLTLLEHGGGYLPLLDHVQKFKTDQISDTQVEIKVETTSGHEYNDIVKFHKFSGDVNK